MAVMPRGGCLPPRSAFAAVAFAVMVFAALAAACLAGAVLGAVAVAARDLLVKKPFAVRRSAGRRTV